MGIGVKVGGINVAVLVRDGVMVFCISGVVFVAVIESVRNVAGV